MAHDQTARTVLLYAYSDHGREQQDKGLVRLKIRGIEWKLSSQALGKPYGLANQKLCYIQMLLNIENIWRARLRTFWRMVGQYGPRFTATLVNIKSYKCQYGFSMGQQPVSVDIFISIFTHISIYKRKHKTWLSLKTLLFVSQPAHCFYICPFYISLRDTV